MSIAEVIAKWSEASTGEMLGGQFVRNGNWQPIARALRHHEKATVAVVSENGAEAVLLITPAERTEEDLKKVPKGKTVGPRPPFHLLVA